MKAETRTSTSRSFHPKVLLGILAVSLALRIVLVFSGGQGFWPDEMRYERSRLAVAALLRGEWKDAERALWQPEHVLFGVLGLAPAVVEAATAPDSTIPAIFFSLFSVASILLLYGVMRRVGQSEQASCVAALLFALSTTQLYYSRHLLPYDAAMALLLGSLYAGLRATESPRASIACGLLSCAGFLTYNGYWLLATFVGLAHVFHAPLSWRLIARRAAWSSTAFAMPIVAIAAADGSLLRRWSAFSRTVSQGNFAEGWSLPFAYLWHAEHLLTVLWAVSFAWTLTRLARGERGGALALGVAGVLFVYGSLVLVSVFLGRFVVYGRHVRQLVPFACILSAAALARAASRGLRGRRLATAVLAGAVVQAALNFRTPLQQVFPREFRRMAARLPDPSGAPRLLLFAEHIYPTPAPVPRRAGEVLLSRPHPLQYLPYQYEGYTPAERAALRSADIRMRVVSVRAAPPAR